MSLVFDMLKLSKAIGKAFTPEQAEVLTEALTVHVADSLATKADLTLLRSELKTELSELRTELKTVIANLRTDLKGDIADLKSEMIRWIVGAIALNFVASTGLMITIAKLVARK